MLGAGPLLPVGGSVMLVYVEIVPLWVVYGERAAVPLPLVGRSGWKVGGLKFFGDPCEDPCVK